MTFGSDRRREARTKNRGSGAVQSSTGERDRKHRGEGLVVLEEQKRVRKKRKGTGMIY